MHIIPIRVHDEFNFLHMKYSNFMQNSKKANEMAYTPHYNVRHSFAEEDPAVDTARQEEKSQRRTKWRTSWEAET